MIARVKIKSKCKIIFLCVNFFQGLKVLASHPTILDATHPACRPACRVKQKFFNKMFAFPQFKTLLSAAELQVPRLHSYGNSSRKKYGPIRWSHSYNNRAQYTQHGVRQNIGNRLSER